MSDSVSYNATHRNRRKSRAVSSLTAQQIKHKRDLDRKAQRALRQRAKSRMQALQEDLARAKTSCPDRERRMMDEIESLREENCRLKSCLEGIGQFALAGVSMREHEQPMDDSRSPDSGLVAEDEPTAGRPAVGVIVD